MTFAAFVAAPFLCAPAPDSHEGHRGGLAPLALLVFRELSFGPTLGCGSLLAFVFASFQYAV